MLEEEFEEKKYYGYRANLMIKEFTIYNTEYNDSASKKKLLFEFFELLKKGKLQSDYNKRVYYLIFIDEYKGVYHCQLARKRKFSKFEMSEKGVKTQLDEDYPFVNIYFDLETQKMLVEYNINIYDTIETCIKVLEKIFCKQYLDKLDVSLEFNSIVNQQSFYNIIEDNMNDIFKVTFKLNEPNWLETKSAAKDFMEEVKKTTDANHASLILSNNEGNLNLNNEGIESFIEYASAGAGNWKVEYKEKDSKKRTSISSQNSSRPIKLKTIKNSNLLSDNYIEIKKAFNRIEEIETFIDGDYNE